MDKTAPRNLKEALQGKLSAKESELLRTSYDTLGNIAIIEIPNGLEKKEKAIAKALLLVNKSVKTVCKKTGAHKGIYRIEPVKIIAGEKNFLATYRESGSVFYVPLGKVFFSPRLGTERLRIAREIKKGEVIGAFFAGVGPFPIVFARNSPMARAVAIELNPVAVTWMKKNIIANKVQAKVEAVKGDVKKIVPRKYRGAFDRVVMPLPKGAENFLREAIISIKPKGGVIHFYSFVPAADPFTGPVKKINEAAKKLKRKVKVIFKRQVRTFSKETVQVVVDFRVGKPK